MEFLRQSFITLTSPTSPLVRPLSDDPALFGRSGPHRHDPRFPIHPVETTAAAVVRPDAVPFMDR
jgi:hypothetical protein